MFLKAGIFWLDPELDPDLEPISRKGSADPDPDQ